MDHGKDVCAFTLFFFSDFPLFLIFLSVFRAIQSSEIFRVFINLLYMFFNKYFVYFNEQIFFLITVQIIFDVRGVFFFFPPTRF